MNTILDVSVISVLFNDHYELCNYQCRMENRCLFNSFRLSLEDIQRPSHHIDKATPNIFSYFKKRYRKSSCSDRYFLEHLCSVKGVSCLGQELPQECRAAFLQEMMRHG